MHYCMHTFQRSPKEYAAADAFAHLATGLTLLDKLPRAFDANFKRVASTVAPDPDAADD